MGRASRRVACSLCLPYFHVRRRISWSCEIWLSRRSGALQSLPDPSAKWQPYQLLRCDFLECCRRHTHSMQDTPELCFRNRASRILQSLKDSEALTYNPNLWSLSPNEQFKHQVSDMNSSTLDLCHQEILFTNTLFFQQKMSGSQGNLTGNLSGRAPVASRPRPPDFPPPLAWDVAKVALGLWSFWGL